MTFENPLNSFGKLNNETNKKNIKEEYPSTPEEKEELLSKVEAFKKRIDSIRGTEEERIMQYHHAINDAKKDGATLRYVKDNFEALFGEEKEKLIDVPSESISYTPIEDSTED